MSVTFDVVCRCNFLNFSKNHECRECGIKAPYGDANGSQNMMPGDWKCPEYVYMNLCC